MAESKFNNSQEHLSHSAGGTGPYLPSPGEFSNTSSFLSYFSFHPSAWQVLVTEGSSMLWPNCPAHTQDWRCDLTAPRWLLTVYLTAAATVTQTAQSSSVQLQNTFHADFAKFLWLQTNLSFKNRCKIVSPHRIKIVEFLQPTQSLRKDWGNSLMEPDSYKLLTEGTLRSH